MSPRNNQASSGLLRLPQCSPRGRVGFKPTVDFGWRHSPSVLRDVVCVHSRTRLRLPPLGTALTVLAQEHTDYMGVQVEGTLKFALVVWLKMWCCLVLHYGEERVLSCGRMRRTDSTSTLTSSLSCFPLSPLIAGIITGTLEWAVQAGHRLSIVRLGHHRSEIGGVWTGEYRRRIRPEGGRTGAALLSLKVSREASSLKLLREKVGLRPWTRSLGRPFP